MIMTLRQKRKCPCGAACAGKFGSSAAVGQILPPKAQMLGRQEWRYVSGGGRALHGAHAAGCDITSLAPSRDGHTLLSRSSDDTLKVETLKPSFLYLSYVGHHPL